MDREESVAALLSESDSWEDEEEENVYKMRNGASSSKNGSLMSKRAKYNKTTRLHWLWKGALVLSVVLNGLFLVLLVLQNKKGADGHNNANVEIDKVVCPPQAPQPNSILSSQSPAARPTLSIPAGYYQTPAISVASDNKSNAISEGDTHNATTTGSPKTEQQQRTDQLQQQQQQQQQQNAPDNACPTPNNILPCGSATKVDHSKTEDKKEKEYRNIFADLTQSEILAVYTYLLGDPRTGVKATSFKDACHVAGIELHTPNKTEALLYLDSYGPKPAREAQVRLSCAHLPAPVMKEIVVGPLPSPTYFKDNPRRKDSTIPYRFHPTYGIGEAYKVVSQSIINSPDLQLLVYESYGARVTSCSNKKCITFLPQKTSSAYDDDVIVTITAYYATQFVTLNPLDLIFVTKETGKYSKKFKLDIIFYGGRSFASVLELVSAYKAGQVNKTRMNFPKPEVNQTSIPGSLNLRGPVFPATPQAGPKSYQPDGKRYSIKDQHVNYLRWNFNLRISKDSGPQMWDVRWGGERIAYEISLQEVGVIYAGADPTSFFSHLSDSAYGLGDKTTGLLPGLDCPEDATFLNQTLASGPGQAVVLPNSMCIFEHNTERPLRRHRNNDPQNGRNHAGVVDRVLIVRTIIVEYNYDYIFDFIFHQNGALELKTFATGYVMSQHYFNGENPFGFRIHENSVGSIHHHIFNYKVDMDILGTSNRYETLDLTLNDHKWPWYHAGKETFKQIAFKHNLKRTEKEAVLRYDYSQPKYHIVYNDEWRNEFGNQRAYRIDTKGFSKQMLPDDSPVLNSRAWAKYEMLTTRRRDTEESSSSIFSMLDGADPHVNVESYLEDDENILDKDLVFWITVGMHHIPHTEDVPNTPTVGTEAAILITPYNYFRECPSAGARDTIKVEQVGTKVRMVNYGVDNKKHCIPTPYDYDKLFSSFNTLYRG